MDVLDIIKKHGHRPAHIHFFATPDGLVPELKKAEGAEGKPYGLSGQFTLIDFDFRMTRERAALPSAEVDRARASA
ncbi:hypothetical protein [Burkholderia anthina]|uniref:hypothetical protein n=1 Tax=Burkholderia anthina TaxID=179879 RepID=UPI003C7D9099